MTPVKNRILFVHNAYQQRGGEDSVVDSELELLTKHGHAVELFSRHNDAIIGKSKMVLAADTIWSVHSARDFREMLAQFKPDVVHVHNTFPLISPAIYWEAAKLRIPVVQTLHNFRLLCPQAMLLRNHQVCEDCMGSLPWRGVVHGCYRNSRLQTAVLTTMLGTHRLLGTWQNKITRYIALNAFCRDKFIQGGLPADKISIKPNFVDFPQPLDVARKGFLYVGRLSKEKGIEVLAQAMQTSPDLCLQVAGTGEESSVIQSIAGVEMLGALPQEAIRQAMGRAVALVIPSIWYENFPRTLVESFASGLPVIASRIGALAELVQEGVTGLLFEAGNATDLAAKLAWAQAHPAEMASMGQRARTLYEAEFTPEKNYQQLIQIYQAAIAAARQNVPKRLQ